MMALYMIIGGLDLLDSLDAIPDKSAIIDWIYGNMILPGGTPREDHRKQPIANICPRHERRRLRVSRGQLARVQALHLRDDSL